MTDSTGFASELKDLKDGKITQIVVTPENFMAFQKAFMGFDFRKRIIGTATEGGKITYIYQQDNG